MAYSRHVYNLRQIQSDIIMADSLGLRQLVWNAFSGHLFDVLRQKPSSGLEAKT